MRPNDVLRSVRELGQFRVKTADGHWCGRIKDVYFDDFTWKATHLVLSIEPSVFGRNELLVAPAEVIEVCDEQGEIRLTISDEGLEQLPLASSVSPVCKQYEAFAYTSPGARKYATGMEADPHLRSAKAVARYQVDAGGEFEGAVADFLYESEAWQIRYLGIEQKFERKTMRFYVLPQAVERITWATQRVILKELNPVAVDLGGNRETVPTVASEAAA